MADAAQTAAFKNLKLPNPPRFSGTPKENFDEWEKKFRNYMSSMVNQKFDDELTYTAKQEAEMTKEIIAQFNDELEEGEAEGRSSMLYYALTSYLEGTAYLIIDQLNDNNGYEAWRRLTKRFLKSKTHSALTTLIAIVNTKFPDDHFETALTTWEKEIQQFERATGSPLPEHIKTGLLIAGTTGKLHDHLCLTCTDLTDYEAIRQSILNYIKTKTLRVPARRNYDPNAMEVDNVQRYRDYKGKGDRKGKTKGKDGKGGKKGKGKGGLSGPPMAYGPPMARGKE